MAGARASTLRDLPTSVPLVIGHRGAPGYRPEHTESAYRLAFSQGADAVEPDLVSTRDGVLVVRHENEISSTTDVAARTDFADRRTTKIIDGVKLTGWFTEDFTWDELTSLRSIERLRSLRPKNFEFEGREPILRFRDVLSITDEAESALGRELTVTVELKHAHYFDSTGLPLDELLIRELAEAGWGDKQHQLIVECFERGVLSRLAESGLRSPRIFLLESKGAPADDAARRGSRASSYAWYRTDAGLDALAGTVAGISVAKRDLFAKGLRRGAARSTNDLVSRAHERGLLVYTWTLRPENFFLHSAFRSGDAPAEWGDWRREFAAIFASGVDGVFVDHVDLGVAARDEFFDRRAGDPH